MNSLMRIKRSRNSKKYAKILEIKCNLCNLFGIRIWTETNIYDKVVRGRKFYVSIYVIYMETLDAHGKKSFMEEKKYNE